MPPNLIPHSLELERARDGKWRSGAYTDFPAPIPSGSLSVRSCSGYQRG